MPNFWGAFTETNDYRIKETNNQFKVLGYYEHFMINLGT